MGALWLEEVIYVRIKNTFENLAIAYVMHEVQLNVMFALV